MENGAEVATQLYTELTNIQVRTDCNIRVV